MTTSTVVLDLLPGECHFGGRELVLRTILGSCVAITLWHPRTLCGAMCHFLLSNRRDSFDEPLSGRYCDEAILLLLREVLRAGQPLREYHVKCFGGGHVLPSIDKTSNVALSNIECMRENLTILGLSIKAEDLGGPYARTIELHNVSGDVFVRTSASTEPISQRLTRASRRGESP